MPSAESRVITVDLGDVTVPVTVHGSGPAVLLVAGGAESSDGYFVGLEKVFETCTVIVQDRPGTGSTPARPSGPDHLDQQARDLRAVVDAVGAGPVVVVAHSLGGPVSIQLAADHPEVVAGLVLLDPTPIGNAVAARGLRLATRVLSVVPSIPLVGSLSKAASVRSMKRKISERPALKPHEEKLLQMLSGDIWSGVVPLLKHFAADGSSLAARLKAQPLAMRGILATADRKPGSPAAKLHAAMAVGTGTNLEVWPGTTHIVQLEEPERVQQAILDLTT